MGASFAVEFKKLRKRPATWATSSIFVVLVVVVTYFLRYLLVSQQGISPQAGEYVASLYPENFVVNVLGLFSGGLGAAAALAFGALSVGSEYRWQTFKLALTQRPGRPSFLAGKFLAVSAILALVVLLALTISAMSSYLVAMLQGNPANWPLPGEILIGAAVGCLTLAVFSVLGFFLAILFKGSAVAIAIGLLYVLVVQDVLLPLLSFQVEAVALASQALPGRNAGDLVNSLESSQQAGQPSGFPPGLEPVDPLQATLILIAYVAVFLAASMFVLGRQDIA